MSAPHQTNPQPAQGYAPQQGYPQQGQPPQGHAPPPQGYAPPPQGYAPPPQGYAPPPQGYAPPPQGYAPPPQGYAPQQGHPPQQGYAPQGYGQPAGTFAPAPGHGIPPAHGAPIPHGVPAYISDANATLKIRLISARNLEAADLNGLSDPFAKFLQGAHTVTSRVIDKTLNPTWNENLSLHVVRPQTDILVVEMYDKDTLSNDLLGFVGIDLGALPKDREVVTWEKLTNCKHGDVQIGLTATGFGFENVPPGYVEHYQSYRSGMAVKPKDKHKDKSKKGAKDKSKKAAKPSGHFNAKNAPHGYTIKNGTLKKKKSEAQKAMDIGKKGGKGLLGFAKALI